VSGVQEQAANNQPLYGAVAAEHLKRPRNLGKLADADGVGLVDEVSTDTLIAVYLKLGPDPQNPDGRRIVAEVRFRAFGCGGCIITGSAATELARGLPLDAVADIDATAIHRAIEDGLPPEQRYCADLAARALRLAAARASDDTSGETRVESESAER
jgi:nitrogen fixation NifU-like protein